MFGESVAIVSDELFLYFCLTYNFLTSN